MKRNNNTQLMVEDKMCLSEAVDRLNQSILLPAITSNIDISKTSWVDILDDYTSGIGLGNHVAKVISNKAYENSTDNPASVFIGRYFDQHVRMLEDSNESVKQLKILAYVDGFLIDKFKTLVGQLENEFEWMDEKVKKDIKNCAIVLSKKITFKILSIDIDSIYYMIQLNAKIKTSNPMEFTEEDVSIMLSPVINSITTDIMAGVTINLYDVIYSNLVTEITLNDFDIICEYMKPYFIDFRDEIMFYIKNLLIQLIGTRVETTHQILEQAKDLADKLGVTYYY